MAKNLEEMKATMYNSGDDNITSVRVALEQSVTQNAGQYKVFTLLQRNSSCRVNITERSCDICAKIIADLC